MASKFRVFITKNPYTDKVISIGYHAQYNPWPTGAEVVAQDLTREQARAEATRLRRNVYPNWEHDLIDSFRPPA